MRCTFDNVNLFIPADEIASLAVVREEGNLLDVPGGDSELIPPPVTGIIPGGVPEGDSELIQPPKVGFIPGGVPDDGSKRIPPGNDPGGEEDKGGVPSATPTLPAVPPRYPWPGGEEEKGGVPSATPTAPAVPPRYPWPGGEEEKGGVPSENPMTVNIYPELAVPSPTIVYPPYDDNWKPLDRKCSEGMEEALEWGVRGDYSICRNPKWAQPDYRQKEIDEYCRIMERFRHACSDDRIPYDFHKFCLNFELDLQKKGLYPPEGDKFWKKVPVHVNGFYDGYGPLLNKIYDACMRDSTYYGSICRKYYLNPPQNPSDYQKLIMSLCGTCRNVSTIPNYCKYERYVYIPPNCANLTNRCLNNIDYLVCNNIKQLEKSRDANFTEISKIRKYCYRYNVISKPIVPAPPIASPINYPIGGEDGTKERPETSPAKPPEEEEEEKPGNTLPSWWCLEYPWYPGCH
jgi:hypothetical protein